MSRPVGIFRGDTGFFQGIKQQFRLVLREITQEPPFWRRLSFGWHNLLYYKVVQ